MVLAEAEDLEADLVGEFDLLDEVAQPLGWPDTTAADRIGADVGEGIQSEVHGSMLLLGPA
jgi:hypothetical protein